MTGLLIAVGIAVFMVTVYGAVMIGGHLLAEIQASEGRDADAATNGSGARLDTTPTKPTVTP